MASPYSEGEGRLRSDIDLFSPQVLFNSVICIVGNNIALYIDNDSEGWDRFVPHCIGNTSSAASTDN